MDKCIIIAIVGASGCGKSYMSQFLREKRGIPAIVSLTTRKKRPEERSGVDHWFVRPDVIRANEEKGNILAHTHFGGAEYCALLSDVPKCGVCTYVIDEYGLEDMQRNFGERFEVVPVLVKMPEELRLRNGISAERISRDAGRHFLAESYFDCVIVNDGSLGDFECKILNLL